MINRISLTDLAYSSALALTAVIGLVQALRGFGEERAA